MKRIILHIVILMTSSSVGISQLPTYIIQSEVFKPGISSIKFSPDGSLLLTGYTDGSFRVLHPSTFQSSLEVKGAHAKPVTAMDMPPKMDFIMTAGGKQIKIWDRDGKLKGNFNGHATTIWNADISPDGKYAVSTAFNKTFLLWDVYNGVIAAHMRGHDDVTLTACISPDNLMIASGSNDTSVKIWDLHSREIIKTLHGPTNDIYDVTFSPDSRQLAVASAENTIRIYSLEDEKIIHLLKGHKGVVRKVVYSPDGAYLLSASEDHTLILWDAVKGERIHLFPDSDGAVLDVEFHPDGLSFYSVSQLGKLSRWEMHPEIFVLRYYESPYREELTADPIFEIKRKGESKKDFLVRHEQARQLKEEILERYYKLYLKEHKQGDTAQ